MFGSKPAPNKFSLQYLKQLHQQLVANQQITPSNQAVVIETLRTLSELVVYGESKAELLFDFFCEKNVMALLVKIVKQKCAPAVHTQVIQTISILVQNVRNNTSLYYLLSNNYVNEIIDNDFDFRDEELQDHFVSFLKTLSLRLNPNTVQFFFNHETHTFPLLTRAISYVTSPEAMIRVAVQTIILNVYKVEDEGLKQYILQDDVISAFFSQLMALMTKLHSNILTAALKVREESDPDESIDNSLASFQDQMYYLQDVLSMEISQVGDSLALFFMAHFVYPVLLKPLIMRKTRTSSNNSRSDSSEPLLVTPDGGTDGDQHELVIKRPSPDVNNEESTAVIVSLFTILQVLSIVSNKQCVVALARALFHPFSVETRARITNSATPDFLPCDPYTPTEERVHPNPYRNALLSLFGEADRFGVLIAAIFERICSHPALTHVVARELGIVSPACHASAELDASDPVPDVAVAPANHDFQFSYLSEVLLQSAAKQHRYSFVTLHLVCRSMQYLYCPTIYDPAVVLAAQPYAESEQMAGKYLKRDIGPSAEVCRWIQGQLADAAAAMKESLRGPLGDLFLNLYEDEVRKAAEMDWDYCVKSLESNSYLVMPATKNVLQRLGVAFMIPSSEVERGRRSIQVYMLLRQLDRAVCQRPEPAEQAERASEPRSSFGGVAPSRTRLQLITDVPMVDEFLLHLSGGTPSIQEEQSLEMRGRDCLACSVIAAPTTPVNESAATAAKPQRRGSKENMAKAQRGSELYMILDDDVLLLATPDRFKLTYGTVKCAVAIHHIDCNIDRQNSKKLQIAARSRRPIGCMRATTTERKKPMSRNLSYAQPPSATVYQMALLFENDPNCRMAKDHIERHRVRLRAEKMHDILQHLESVAASHEAAPSGEEEQRQASQQQEESKQHENEAAAVADGDSKVEEEDVVV